MGFFRRFKRRELHQAPPTLAEVEQELEERETFSQITFSIPTPPGQVSFVHRHSFDLSGVESTHFHNIFLRVVREIQAQNNGRVALDSYFLDNLFMDICDSINANPRYRTQLIMAKNDSKTYHQLVVDFQDSAGLYGDEINLLQFAIEENKSIQSLYLSPHGVKMERHYLVTPKKIIGGRLRAELGRQTRDFKLDSIRSVRLLTKGLPVGSQQFIHMSFSPEGETMAVNLLMSDRSMEDLTRSGEF